MYPRQFRFYYFSQNLSIHIVSSLVLLGWDLQVLLIPELALVSFLLGTAFCKEGGGTACVVMSSGRLSRCQAMIHKTHLCLGFSPVTLTMCISFIQVKELIVLHVCVMNSFKEPSLRHTSVTGS